MVARHRHNSFLRSLVNRARACDVTPQSCRQYVETYFTLDRMVGEYARVFAECLATSGGIAPRKTMNPAALSHNQITCIA